MSAYAGFGYDPEAVIQDADIEQAEFEAEGRAFAAAKRAGRCTHSSTVGFVGTIHYPEQVGLKPGQQRCTEKTNGCAAVFDSDEEWHDAMMGAVYGS
jgi:hypothetical protein